MRPGRVHDTRAARYHDGLLDKLAKWATGGRRVLADLGYQGEADRLLVPPKIPRGEKLGVDQKALHLLHSCTRALAERGNALLNYHKAMRRVTLPGPGRTHYRRDPRPTPHRARSHH